MYQSEQDISRRQLKNGNTKGFWAGWILNINYLSKQAERNHFFELIAAMRADLKEKFFEAALSPRRESIWKNNYKKIDKSVIALRFFFPFKRAFTSKNMDYNFKTRHIGWVIIKLTKFYSSFIRRHDLLLLNFKIYNAWALYMHLSHEFLASLKCNNRLATLQELFQLK